MREKTRTELASLADKIVEEFDLDKIIGSNEFLEAALDLAEENDIEVGRQTLLKYETDLKLMCKVKADDAKFTEDKFDQFLETYPEGKKLIMTINFYDDGSYEKVKPEGVVKSTIKIPEWTMFAEGEDGLLILKGRYAGKYITDINEVAGFGTAKVGWAKWCLSNDKNLTEDDREVFNKIILGYL